MPGGPPGKFPLALKRAEAIEAPRYLIVNDFAAVRVGEIEFAAAIRNRGEGQHFGGIHGVPPFAAAEATPPPRNLSEAFQRLLTKA